MPLSLLSFFSTSIFPSFFSFFILFSSRFIGETINQY